MLSRRSFLKSAGLGAAALGCATWSEALPLWAEPPRSAPSDGAVLLNSNENAYGPLPSVLALQNPFADANRYPFQARKTLTERLAALHRVGVEQIFLGCGSSEVLKSAVSAFAGPGRGVVMASPTFEAVGAYATAAGAPVARVPLAGDYSHDLAAMLDAAKRKGSGLVYICNPNNPTASLTPRKQIEAAVASMPPNTYVLVDEAYHDFVPADAPYRSFLDAPVDSDRVIVARTFSKIYGLAGLRIGYGVAPAAVVRKMQVHAVDLGTNIFALRCALASLDDRAGHAGAAERNARDRDEFFRQAAARRIPAIRSSANFAMVETGRPVRTVIEHFRRNGVEIGRPFPPLETHARISFGTPEQMGRFWQVWDRMA